jgi:hypothetical protein
LQADELDDLLETEKVLGSAASTALEEGENDVDDEYDESDNKDYIGTSMSDRIAIENNNLISAETTIHLTSDVVKWIRQSDGKFRELFVRRIKQLQKGDRSRILAKSLKGSKSIIFETYLEQRWGYIDLVCRQA